MSLSICYGSQHWSLTVPKKTPKVQLYVNIFISRHLTLSDTSNELNTSPTYNSSGVEENDDLPTMEKVLFGVRNTHEWQKTGLGDRYVTGGL